MSSSLLKIETDLLYWIRKEKIQGKRSVKQEWMVGNGGVYE